jgi:hypothetical protein
MAASMAPQVPWQEVGRCEWFGRRTATATCSSSPRGGGPLFFEVALAGSEQAVSCGGQVSPAEPFVVQGRPHPPAPPLGGAWSSHRLTSHKSIGVPATQVLAVVAEHSTSMCVRAHRSPPLALLPTRCACPTRPLRPALIDNDGGTQRGSGRQLQRGAKANDWHGTSRGIEEIGPRVQVGFPAEHYYYAPKTVV